MRFWNWLKQWWVSKNEREEVVVPKIRICERCKLQIKRNHKWSAKTWDDKKPRHWDCNNPEGVQVESDMATVEVPNKSESADDLPFVPEVTSVGQQGE